MKSRYLTVDGFIHSTGLRDQFLGVYIELNTLNLNEDFLSRFTSWLSNYKKSQKIYDNISSEKYLHRLDDEGLKLAKELKNMLNGECKIEYYSDAFSKRFSV
ncbi:hypothetical protein [Hymenobacter sp. IS2118]|uniref:hypothetical protein n=1 Tax=Hymenobacter sp. IS2118 TaxID=1505605 RepID=UPI000552B419|nr:hypothetical protein [Hymenobacter sp. IS2118]